MNSPLTSKSWYVLWKYLRESPTLGDLRQRLDRLQIIYPSKSAVSYIAFLWSTSAHWALCCFNWDLTLGYQATSLQEGIHSSMKNRLRNQKIGVHEVVHFFRDVMCNRKFNRESNTERSTLKQLYHDAKEKKLSSLSEKFEIYLTEEAQQKAFKLLHSGFNYDVEKLENDNEIIESYEECKYRNTSAERFKLIIDSHLSSKCIVTFYKVIVRFEEQVDLVAVFNNGSFACTDPHFANHGLPSSQIMSVFIAGYISINVIFHFHPLYLQPFCKDLDHSLAKSLSVKILNKKNIICTEVDVDASWNYGITVTQSEWQSIGLGGNRYNSIVNPPVNAIKNHTDSIAEICKKELHKLLPVIIQVEKFRTMIFKTIGDIKIIQANDAQCYAQARHKSLGYDPNSIPVCASSSSVSVPPLVVANHLFDRGQKRKTAGKEVRENSKKKST